MLRANYQDYDAMLKISHEDDKQGKREIVGCIIFIAYIITCIILEGGMSI